MRIDLHTHSTISDGSDTPAELVAKAAAAQIDVLGITDHDTIGGWEEAQKAIAATNLRLICGMETTTTYHGITVHLLAYLFDPNNAALQKHFAQMKKIRAERVIEMAHRVSLDYPISISRILNSVGENGTLGRPHIADELVRIKIVENRTQAFKIITPSSKYYVRNESPDLLEVISWIREAGGKSVIAHPKAVSRGKILSDHGIRESAQAGLFGIEIWHRDNHENMRADLIRLATELGLEKFGASDYHGFGKPNQIGENTTPVAAYENLIKGTFGKVISGNAGVEDVKLSS